MMMKMKLAAVYLGLLIEYQMQPHQHYSRHVVVFYKQHRYYKYQFGMAQQHMLYVEINGVIMFCFKKQDCHHPQHLPIGLMIQTTATNDDCMDGNQIHVNTSLFSNRSTEILIKPNAGGFGAGIQKIEKPLQPKSSSEDSMMFPIPKPSFDDNMALIQQYEKPKDDKLYRIWFLNGKVQCAIERTLMSESGSTDDEFTSGCAAGMCSMRSSSNNKKDQSSLSEKNVTVAAWSVPKEVQDELEKQLLPLLPDAHCGSVEFLYSRQNEEEEESTTTQQQTNVYILI